MMKSFHFILFFFYKSKNKYIPSSFSSIHLQQQQQKKTKLNSILSVFIFLYISVERREFHCIKFVDSMISVVNVMDHRFQCLLHRHHHHHHHLQQEYLIYENHLIQLVFLHRILMKIFSEDLKMFSVKIEYKR